MRRSATVVAALATSAVLVLGGCGSDSEPSPAADPGQQSSTPEDSPAPDDSETPTDEPVEPGDVNDFPEVAGFTYQKLPGVALDAFSQAVEGTPEVGKAAGRLVMKDGQQIGMVMQIQIDPSAAGADGFEDAFLPGFAQGIAGAAGQPKIEDVNGTNVVKVEAPSAGGTAYAWIDDAIATVLVFKSAADAEAFAQGALD